MADRGTLGSAEAYNIAWIVSLPHERTVANAVLDERHNEPHGFNAQKHEHDRNSYSFGRIGHHCVVIVSLPAGRYESTSTEVMVQGLRNSLPHIRFGLLVGSGTGVPGERIKRSGELVANRDIRLGDVVVGSPGVDADGQRAGVAQDYGNGVKDEFLGVPSALRSALLTIHSEHELDGAKFPDTIDKVFQRYPHLQKLYSNPGVEQEWDEADGDSDSDSDDQLSFTPDRFFKSKYEHVEGSTCANCDVSGELKRKKRNNADPKVHVGPVILCPPAFKMASRQNRIAVLLAQEPYTDTLCLDSEAFGLPKDFPCLLIKGICDYGDDHPYGRWQKFAALSAAAFAKELLGFVGTGDVERSPRI